MERVSIDILSYGGVSRGFIYIYVHIYLCIDTSTYIDRYACIYIVVFITIS
jgi:hypothetical protein